ncbi:DUF1849 family protein [Rhabdaerophilum sp. SD176]|uniref:EipB family protein n=1 Tax=Rhabdaerophilum sp. SD176 TaxID=2983548 RepID=UPI0024DFD782|nr:DUF1849 family protein [Rhabdaerophilum sp. SD176]
MQRLLAATLLVPLLAAAPAFAQGVPPGGVQLQPHRIAYEITLGGRSGSALTAASGLMALEFTGNRCDGFVTNFRQATILADSDGQSRNLDFRVNLWEEGAGKRFRFTVKNDVNGRTTRDADGEAQRVRDGSVSVAMKKPRGKKGDFDGNILFPSAMMIQLVEAALKGERRYEARLFDGSEGGEKVFETVASIGPKLEGDRNRRLEPALQVSSLEKVPRWPVSMAYFDGGPGDRVPVYTMKSVTFANGVVSDLLFEFPEFSLAAKAVRYEPLPEEACTR